MDFGLALDQMKLERRVTRVSANGDCFIFLVPGSDIIVEEGRPLVSAFDVGTAVRYRAHIDICYCVCTPPVVLPYQPSQEDLLADDWILWKRPDEWTTVL